LPDEEYIEAALRLLKDYASGLINLSAPAILPLEIGNALWRAVKLNRLSQADAQLSLKKLGVVGLELYEIDWAEASEVLVIASQFDIAVYDATYLFLSDKLKVPFVTADDKLIHKVQNHFKLINLKEYV